MLCEVFYDPEQFDNANKSIAIYSMMALIGVKRIPKIVLEIFIEMSFFRISPI